MPRTFAVAVAQIAVVAGLVWLWSTGDSDATATTVDWAFVGLTAATPVLLGISALAGWKVGKRPHMILPRPVRVLSLVARWATLGLLAPALCMAPLVIFGAVVFAPMG